MKKSKTTTTDNFLEALRNYVPPPEVIFEYRVYYDPLTREAIYKTIDKDDGTFLVVTEEEYEGIDFCPNFKVTAKNKLVKKTFDFLTQKLLQLNTVGYKAVKHNNIFVATEDYVGATDTWNLRTSADDETDN